MSSLTLLLIPFARLAGHSLASSLGFVGIALISVLPVHTVQVLSSHGYLQASDVKPLEFLETALLALDILLLAFVVLLYSCVFAVEQWRAAKKILFGATN